MSLLIGLLSRRLGAVDAADDSFRWRGAGVSRIEGLSDTVFGFAITLLVVSLEVPRTADELLTMMLGFIPFIASFSVLFGFWRAQFEFFRRYGLEDKRTATLTGMLLIGVLFAVYPLKFLFTFVLLTLPRAYLFGDSVGVQHVMPLEKLPRVMGLYGAGLLWISWVFGRLYAHAGRQGEALAFTELERFETDAASRRWVLGAVAGGTLIAWCLALLAIGDHFHARDRLFEVVYYGGLVAIVVNAISQSIVRRNTSRARLALQARTRTADTGL